MLKAENLSKSYGNKQVVKNVSLNVQEGEVVGLSKVPGEPVSIGGMLSAVVKHCCGVNAIWPVTHYEDAAA